MLSIGYILDGRYEVIKVLGSGGMGTVYLCRNNRLGNLWALKEVAGEVKEYMDLLAEPNILKKLNHTGIPRIVDIFFENDSLYIVEDYIEGDTLEALVKKNGRLEFSRICEIATELCSIIEYLHSFSPPIIYRDLKPSNVMVTVRGSIVLIDFGISRTYKSGKDGDTIFMGSKGYAAPEQYGKAQSCRQTDIYGLGATMYFMTMGEVPQHSMGLSEDEDTSVMDEGLRKIILKAMQTDASLRYSSVKEMKSDIMSLMNKYGKTSVIESGIPGAETYGKSRPSGKVYKIAAGVLIFILAMLGVQYAIWGRGNNPSQAINKSSSSEVAKTSAPTPSMKPAETTPTPAVTPTPVKDMFVRGVIDMKDEKSESKGKAKGKYKIKHDEEMMYKVNPASVAGGFENKLIMKFEYIKKWGDYISVYCTVENNTGNLLEISYGETYLYNDEGEYVKTYGADAFKEVSIPAGSREQDVEFIFKDFDMDTGDIVLKTRITSVDPEYSKYISLEAAIK